MRILSIACWLLTISCAKHVFSSEADRDPPHILNDKPQKAKLKLAFGSCYRNWYYKNRTEIFTSIRNTDPDVFIWTGDAIYANRAHWFFGITPVRFSLSEVDQFFTDMTEDTRKC